jgi:hypothetical protein
MKENKIPVYMSGLTASEVMELQSKVAKLEQRNKELEAKYLKAVDLADRASDSALEYAAKYAHQILNVDEIKAQAMEEAAGKIYEYGSYL